MNNREKRECTSCGCEMEERRESYATECERCMNEHAE
ncbi:YhfH family protein [Alicyclobacillus tolerans]|nr:protein YhfH [Alicyclobacillus tolerans]MCF8566484.1 YhfH family protein [Alicyclobacillus tolerans]